ncbi:MAG TPA: TIGR00282 family metallophosphoesterase [Patescibacteria group bacterium]|nr:TIGR00282 family metallophosphoesterase [Patescibacteria group bacterium]
MKILYIGDVMAQPGLDIVSNVLPKLKQKYDIDLVIAQAENVSDGKGTEEDDYKKLLSLGIDFCSGGNWSLFRQSIYPYFEDPSEPIIRPANYPKGTPGQEYKFIEKNNKRILVVSLLGQVIGRDADKPNQNPLKKIDEILLKTINENKDAIIVNFHGDFSSQKVIIGHYLDGRVSAVIGDHWHVPTADARILTNGTAHISDVGMCGILNASLGVSYNSVIPRWRDNIKTKNELETLGPKQFNAVLITTNNLLAKSIEPIQQIID